MRIRGLGLEPEAAALVFERLEAAVPHLNFEAWRIRDAESKEAPAGSANWRGQDNCEIDVRVHLADVTFWSRCRRDEGAIARDDNRFLGSLARETAQVLTGGMTGPISVVDYGTSSVAREIRDRGELGFDPLPVLQFVRSLSQETYEGQRLSYGLILAPSDGGGSPFTSAFENKRFKRITDGFSTALVLDRRGRVVEIVSLQTPEAEGTARKRRPWWAAAIAEAAAKRGGVGVALTRNGDILVVHDGKLAFNQRAGKWSKWDHAAILKKLRALFDFRGAPQQIADVLSYLYHVALDLAFRRSGGLLIVVGSEDRLKRLLTGSSDILTSARRKEPEKSLDSSLTARAIYRSDRRVTGDLASLDGALAVDRTGELLAYGAMTKSSGAAQQGARTRAAHAASREGVAIKVSADGDIGFYRSGKRHFEI